MQDKGAVRNLVLLFIRLYQRLLSPLLPPACRFFPSCSAYSYEAVQRFGTVRGGFLALSRICKCHPFHSGGFDPVPHRPHVPLHPSQE